MTDPYRTRRKLAAKRQNERVKLFASLFNALAVGTIAAGAIIPATRTPIDFSWVTLAWIGIGSGLHLVGQAAYAILQSEE